MTPPARTAQFTVNRPLTRKRRSRVVENDEYAAFLRRVIRAYSRRIAAGDIEAITDHDRPGRPPRPRHPPGHHRPAHPRLLLGRHRHAARHHPPRRPATLGQTTTTPVTTPDGTRHQREPPVTRTTGPLLALAPGPRQGPGTGANTGPRTSPPRGPSSPTNASSPRCTLPDMTPGSITSGTPPPAPVLSGCAASSAMSTPLPASCCVPSLPSACRTA